MKFIITIAAVLFATTQVSAQDGGLPLGSKRYIEGYGEVYDHPEKFPVFPGGMEAFEEYLVNNIKYPEEAVQNNITGHVYISTIILETGEIKEVKILKDIGGGCGAEAKRVVESMPDWEPGIMNGKPVNTRISVRIKFTIKDFFDKEFTGKDSFFEDTPPKFPGGDEALSKYIKENLVVPDEVSTKQMDDYAVVAFLIDESGLVKSPRLVKGVSMCNECGRNAIKVIKDMPAWSPGIFQGRYSSMEPELKIWFSYKSETNSGSDANGQAVNSTWEVAPDSSGIYEMVDKDPVYPGGQEAYINYLEKSIKYPEEAMKKRIDGTVYLSVVINETGEVTDVKVLKDIGGGCGAEAMRVVKEMPNWIPGVYKDKPVKVRIPVKIKFTPALYPSNSAGE